jgi:hypothetical protein
MSNPQTIFFFWEIFLLYSLDGFEMTNLDYIYASVLVTGKDAGTYAYSYFKYCICIDFL